MNCGAAGAVESHRTLDSPFPTWPNYAIVSSVLGALLFTGSVRATIINARSPSVADVRAAIATAADGDTVIIPAGRATWTSCLVIAKGITLQGQTTVDSNKGTASDQTVIVDNLPRIPGGQGFIEAKIPAGKSFRITGITFSGIGGTTQTMFNGAIRVSGGSNQVRIDQCHTTNLHHQPSIMIFSTIYGVADHNFFENPSQMAAFNFKNGTGYGDLEFSQEAGYGGPNFFFVEDNYMLNIFGTHNAASSIDGIQGAKYVIRHNHLYDIEILCHGTEGSRLRGGRAQEIYNNDYHWSAITTMDGIRSGTLIVHDNTYDGVQPRGYGLQTYRLFFNFHAIWGGATGDNPWDYNATEPDGSHVDGHAPYLFERGTVTGGSGTQLIDTTKNWTTNRWQGFTAKNVADDQVGDILSNTNNALDVEFYSDSGGGHVWKRGDRYEIHKVIKAIDQPGLGAGDPIGGDNAAPAWLHQVTEGCYSWNNIYTPTGAHINFSVAPTTQWTLLQGRDYFNDTPKPGYTPYTYPHPLTEGLPPPEKTTRNSTGNRQRHSHEKRRPWGGKTPEKKKVRRAKDSPANELPED